MVIDRSAIFAAIAAEPDSSLDRTAILSYALAKTRDLPLLFKGNDFAATDIRPVLSAQP